MFPNLSQFVSILDEYPGDVDYWYDVGCVLASDLLDSNPSVLIELQGVVKDWPDSRREKLAYVLGEYNGLDESIVQIERELLEWLMTCDNLDVVITARESLSHMLYRRT